METAARLPRTASAPRRRAFSLPQADDEVDQRVAENWGQLTLLVGQPEAKARELMKILACWPDIEPYGTDKVWQAIQRRAEEGTPAEDSDDLDTPEWEAFTRSDPIELPDFSTRREPVPVNIAAGCMRSPWFPGSVKWPHCTALPGSTPRNGT